MIKCADVATLNVVMLPPLGNCFVSGSRPRTPITVTLFKFSILHTCDSYCRNSRPLKKPVYRGAVYRPLLRAFKYKLNAVIIIASVFN